MTRTDRTTALVSILLGAACATDAPGALPGKADVATGKADGVATDAWCEAFDAPPDCDVCEVAGWYGDGTCDGFCDAPDPDCGAATPAGITAHLGGGALPPVDPALGVWAIHKPGVVATAEWFASAAPLAELLGVAWAIEPISCAITAGPSAAGCEEGEPREVPDGCYLEAGAGLGTATSTLRTLEEFEFVTPTAEAYARAAASDAAITHRVTATDRAVDFLYGVVDDQLVLIAVDVARLDCSS